MDRTLDSIRPSDIEGTTADMTYLYSRDPSIVAYGQRPIPSSKQNLMSLFENEETEYLGETSSTASMSGAFQTLKVYLRMKPFPRKHKLTKEEIDAYQIANSTTLITKLPTLDHTFNSFKGQKHTDSVCRKFTFSQTFGPETTQLQLFEEVIQPRMVDFLDGQNCTVMTYGTTNSGKSYTLQGTTTSPGIIPRGLEFVFSNINPRPTPCYKPTQNSNVVCLNPVERAQEIEAKSKLLTFASIDKHHYMNAYKQMQKLLREESPIRPSQACDAHYSVWVSFAEIYNENIYDLLSNDCQKRRPLLKLGADSQDRAFIRGLKTVCVTSGSEAYQVLMAGQYNLKVAATALNARSSRSHCIFTIQLLKYYAENIPESVEVSNFTFCDLAGSERLKKTLNVGERLKEAQNINTSLLVLGRCLKSIYEVQSIKSKYEHVGPFRESKLTRLFQRALSGKEQIALIVNVNPIPNLYIETQNVLNFSAIAKKIIIEPKKILRKVSHSRFSQIVAQSRKSNTDWDPSDLCHIQESVDETEVDSVINPEDYEDLLDENKSLKSEIAMLKASMLKKDFQIRQELTKTYTDMIKKLEIDWQNRIKDVEAQTEDHFEWRVSVVEAFYKDKLNELSSRKRRRTSDSGSDDEAESRDELEIENSRLQAKVHSLKKTVKHLRDNNETLLTDKNKLAFECGLANDELKSLKSLLSSAEEDLCKDEESITYVEGLRKQLSDKQEHVKKLKEFLNEAKEEYINISSHAEMMENRLKECEEALAESAENETDLKMLLENTNACLEEKTKAMDALEDKLNQQTMLMLRAEERHTKKESKFMETIRKLQEKIECLEKSSASDNSRSDSAVPYIKIKQEVSSLSEEESPTEFPKTVMPDGVFIKTDRDEILGIPTSKYDDDRESEMFVQVREITVEENIDQEACEELVEIREKLSATENENQSLRNKLSQSLKEIQSLKESLNSTKEQLNDITMRVKEIQDAQNVESEARARNDSQAKKTLEECASFTDTESQTDRILMIEGGNQTDSVVDINKSMQTSFAAPAEEHKSVQTATSENDELVKSENLLAVFKGKCSELEAECKVKQSLISKLEQEIDQLRGLNNSLEQRSNEDRANIEKLTNAVLSAEKNLGTAVTERDSAKKILEETEEIRRKLEIQISECRDEHQSKITSLTENLASTSAEREKIEKKLLETEELRKNLENQITEYRNIHELNMTNVKEELTASKERENVQQEAIKTHAEKISELQLKFAAKAKDQENKIRELNESVERYVIANKQLEDKIEANLKDREQLTNQLQQAKKRDQEKDEEIRALQKSYKAHISSDVNDKRIHEELKKNLKELLETKDALARSDDLYERLSASSKKEIKSLEAHISSLEKSSKAMEIVHQNERADAERLRIERDELKIILSEKEREFESFTTNRDKMIVQYEALVKSRQEELERANKEVTRLQEMAHRMQITPRGKVQKTDEDEQKEHVQIIDLSDSETKKTRRRAALPPPQSETKRCTRRRKLYAPSEDSCVDLESCDAVPPTPSPSASTRSLRNRKK